MAVMQVSERFACRVTGQHRTTQRHRPVSQTLADPDAALRAWLRQWAKEHPRWGFAAPTMPPAPRAGSSTTSGCRRLWREEGLRVPQRRRRKRIGTSTTTRHPGG